MQENNKIALKNWSIAILATITVSLFPVLFLYSQNAEEVSISECILPAIIFCGMGAVLLGIATLVAKNVHKGAIIASISMIAFLNFAIIEKMMCIVVPSLRYWQCLPIMVIVLVHIGALISKKISIDGSKSAVKIIGGVFGLLILLNLAMATPTIIDKVTFKMQTSVSQTESIADKKGNNEKLPNIYYIICDEYSGFEAIRKIYDYDNEPFARHLEELGFSVSRDSYNEAILTTTVTANLMALEYEVDSNSTVQEKDAIRKNSEFFRILREQGYEIQGVGNDATLYGLERKDADSSETSSKTMQGDTFRDILIDKTVLYIFNLKQESLKQKDILRTFEYMKEDKNFTQNGIFTMMHVVCPHVPFIFDKNGEMVDSHNWINWENPEYYLGQYIYCTKLIDEMVSSIIERDSNSIIILQSDHGARVNSVKYKEKGIKDEDMKNILNAVYIGGEEFDEMQGLSGVNTLRLLLNKIFGYEYEILEVPNAEKEN